MKLDLIQCLRGVAAMMVVFFHFAIFLKPISPESSALFAYGYLGVDIFFVISGFIIYVSTEKVATRDGAVFLIRRVCRVVLPAWVAMLLSISVKPPLFSDLLLGVFFIPMQNATPPGFGYSFLIVAWTLTYELVFYGIFAAVLWTDFGRKHRGLVAGVALAGIVAMVQILTHTFTLDAQSGPVVQLDWRYFPGQLISLLGNPILLEFIVGIFLGWAYSSGRFDRCSVLLSTAIFILCATLVLAFQFRPGHGLSCGGLFAAMVVVYVLALQAWWDRERLSKLSARRWDRLLVPAIFIGDISYSLYLIHPSIRAFLLRFANSDKSAFLTDWNLVVALALTFTVSVLFYRWIELPSQRFGRFVASRSRATRFAHG